MSLLLKVLHKSGGGTSLPTRASLANQSRKRFFRRIQVLLVTRSAVAKVHCITNVTWAGQAQWLSFTVGDGLLPSLHVHEYFDRGLPPAP